MEIQFGSMWISRPRRGSCHRPGLSGVRVEGDVNYFSRRAKEERSAAGRCVHDGARLIHLEMASRYEKLAAAIDAREHKPGVDLTVAI